MLKNNIEMDIKMRCIEKSTVNALLGCHDLALSC